MSMAGTVNLIKTFNKAVLRETCVVRVNGLEIALISACFPRLRA
jgi:hypothetical protein